MSDGVRGLSAELKTRKMFPGCGSAWKCPSIATCLRYALPNSSASAERSWSSRASGGISFTFTPRTRSVVRTRSAVYAFDDLRYEQARKLGQRAPEQRHVARFDAVVQLVGERALELLYDADHVDACRRRANVRGEKLRELAEELDVVGERRANVGSLHLDDDGASVAQRGGVRLTETRGRERLVIEGRKQLADSTAELLLNDLFDVGERNGADVVLQTLRAARCTASGMRSGRVDSTCPSFTYAGPSSTSRLRNATARSTVPSPFVCVRGFVGREVDQSLLSGEVAKAVAGEQPDGRRQPWQEARSQDHTAEQGRKQAS